MKTGLLTLSRTITAASMADARKISSERAQWIVDDRLDWILYQLRHEVGTLTGLEYDRASSSAVRKPPVRIDWPEPTILLVNGETVVTAHCLIRHADPNDCPVDGYAFIANPPPNTNTVYLLPEYHGEPGDIQVKVRRFVCENLGVFDDKGRGYQAWRRIE